MKIKKIKYTGDNVDKGAEFFGLIDCGKFNVTNTRFTNKATKTMIIPDAFDQEIKLNDYVCQNPDGTFFLLKKTDYEESIDE